MGALRFSRQNYQWRSETKKFVQNRRQAKKAADRIAKQQEQFDRLRECLANEQVDESLAIQKQKTHHLIECIPKNASLGLQKRKEKIFGLQQLMKLKKEERNSHLPLFRANTDFYKAFGNKTKLDYKKLPCIQFPGNISVITSSKEEEQYTAELKEIGMAGMDTECRPRFHMDQPHNPVCLIQIATMDRAFLYRIKQNERLPPQLTQLLADPLVLKVGHSLHDDCRILNNLNQVHKVASTIDTLQLALKLGCLRPGLKTLCQALVGGDISKDMQLSDWEAPQLSMQQLQYAATDAWAPLLVLHKMLQFANTMQLLKLKTYTRNENCCVDHKYQHIFDRISRHTEGFTISNLTQET